MDNSSSTLQKKNLDIKCFPRFFAIICKIWQARENLDTKLRNSGLSLHFKVACGLVSPSAKNSRKQQMFFSHKKQTGFRVDSEIGECLLTRKVNY